MILGVDNGACSGAIVALSPLDGSILGYSGLPNHKVGNKTELDTQALKHWIKGFEVEPTVIAVEEPLHHAPSSQSMRSMAMCYGQILGMAVGVGWNFASVGVREWQKEVLGKFPQGQSKKYATAKAAELAPHERWLDPSKPRARKAHDGIIDAYLIAHYAWEKGK